MHAGETLVAQRAPSRWALGDWLVFGTERFGVDYARAGVIVGYEIQTLRNGVYVASRFEPRRRRARVSWSHHAALASFTVELQELWLDRVESDRLSLRRLREAVTDARSLSIDQAFAAAAERPACCPHCGRDIVQLANQVRN
jgi:hypothetical protein